jgi:hypothetical protein
MSTANIDPQLIKFTVRNLDQPTTSSVSSINMIISGRNV